MAKKRTNRTFNRGNQNIIPVDELENDPGEEFTEKRQNKKRPAKKPITRPSGRKRINLDQRASQARKKGEKAERGRLTKKGKKTLEEWKGTNRSKKRDSYFRSIAESARSKFGHGGVMAGSDTNQMVLGIPMPSLALEWLIQQDVLPLGVILMLVGKWRTCKSALLYEIFRWFEKCNGGAILCEAETKFSNDLCQSIMQYEDDECPIILNRCKSVEEWQRYLTYYMNEQKRRMIGTANEPGPGRTIPVCYAVDSLSGKSSEEKLEKLKKEGSTGRAFPVEALINTEFIRAISGELDNWPFSLILINHLKEKMNTETGESTRHTPGGAFVSFQESFEIETSIWKSKIDTTHFDGHGVRLKCMKNSFGASERSIKTRMLWWDEQIGVAENGDPIYKQQTVWDWDWATITCLSTLPAKYTQRLKEIGFDLSVKSPTADVECLANCQAAGMAKDEYLPFQEVGRLIRENEELTNRIRNALGIKRRAVLEGDYLEQLEGLKEELE